MTFDDIIKIMLGWKGRTTTMELFDFYQKAQKRAVSKQDYSKQRQKIKIGFFIDAMNEVILDFYENYKYETYKGYILVAIDGSKTILPRVKELEEIYGLANANNSQQKCVQCNISGCYDCLNGIMLDAQIGPYASDERELAKNNLEALRKKMPDKKFLIIFDRGYPSIDMMNFLDKNNFKYIIRSQDSTYSKEKRKMTTNDEYVEIELNADRLAGKMSEETYNELKEMKSYKTRFVKYKLSTGNMEWLITNMEKDKISGEEIGKLYFKRWKIEIWFNTLKNKLEIENISGKKELTVLQDIYSTMIIYNIIAVMNYLLKDEVINNDKDIMVLFYAPWCNHCKEFMPKYEEIAKFTFDEYGKATVVVTNKTTPAKLSVDGNTIKGLPMGTYYAKETHVVEGYMQDTEEHTYTISYKDMNTPVIKTSDTLKNTVQKAKFEVIKIF